ncbi:MAG: leucine-rich repeat protein [Clostridiales bacterium]|nr:leucine-rich repeat protein [Clostridiales bacterium]
MVCPKCGMNLEQNLKHCPYCGTEIILIPSANLDDNSKSPDNHGDFARTKRSTPSKGLFIVAAAIVLVVALTVFVFGNKTERESSDITAELADISFIASRSEGGYEYDVYSDHIVITDIRYTDADGQLIIPSELEGKPVTEIRNDALLGLSCYDVSYLEIPSSITSIGYNAFYQDSALEVVVGGDGLKELGAGAFYNTPWLNEQTEEYVTIGDGILLKYNGSDQSIRIPDGVKFIADYAFEGHDIVSVSFPASVKKIGDYAFVSMKTLEQIDFSDGLIEIGNAAFAGCEKLHNIDLPDSLESIGVSAFEQCISLTNIAIPKNTQAIDENAFKDTPFGESLRDEFVIVGDGILLKYNGTSHYVDIPDGVKSIGAAFSGNELLQGVIVPDGTTRIGRFAFSGCTSLQSVTLPDTLTQIEYGAFRGCREMARIALPENLQVIEAYSLKKKKKLQITLPESVLYIGKSAFSGCESITRMVIPPNVHRLYSETFEFCHSLRVICLTDSIRDIEYRAFYGTSELVICCEKDGIAYQYARENDIKTAEEQEDGTYRSTDMHTGLIWFDYYSDAGFHTKYECYLIDVESDISGGAPEDSTGELIEASENEYDEAGNLIITKFYDSFMALSSYTKYQYGPNGLLVLSESFGSNDSLQYCVSYDEEGQFLSSKSFDENGNLTGYRLVEVIDSYGSKIRMICTYDAQGNLINMRDE